MTEDREERCAAIAVPVGLSVAVTGYQWARNKAGMSGGRVWRLDGKPGVPDLFLKQGSAAIADDLAEELAKSRWLAAHVPVPEVTHAACLPGETWLLMTALPGLTAYQLLEVADPQERPAIVDALVDFLRRLHAIPMDACPFRSDLSYRLRLARARVDAGLVEENAFDEPRRAGRPGRSGTRYRRCCPSRLIPWSRMAISRSTIS